MPGVGVAGRHSRFSLRGVGRRDELRAGEEVVRRPQRRCAAPALRRLGAANHLRIDCVQRLIGTCGSVVLGGGRATDPVRFNQEHTLLNLGGPDTFSLHAHNTCRRNGWAPLGTNAVMESCSLAGFVFGMRWFRF